MNGVAKFSINGRAIGPSHPTYIIAEMSCNHCQDYDVAVKIVEAAARAGADAIKLQTYTPDTMTIDCDNDFFTLKGTIWDGQKLYDLYKTAYTPWDWTPKLKKLANQLGMDLFSSPFDATAVDFLEEVGTPCYKVASFEVVDHILLKKIAETKKPVIMSSGMASLADIASAVQVLRSNGTTELAILKCTSAYPAKPEDANLANIPHLAQTFNVVSGLSDHTLGTQVPVVSVALGGCIIEKHFTLSRESGSADDAFSLTEDEFAAMVKAVRVAEKVTGKITYGGVEAENDTKGLRRSLFIVQDVKAGEVFTEENVRSIRPGNGLHTKYFGKIIGKKSRRDCKKGTPVSWDLIE